MPQFLVFDSENKPSIEEKQDIINFLFDNLNPFGDPKDQIEKAMNFAFKVANPFGGFVIVLKDNSSIKAAAVVNNTGMGGYIPDHILVYIAVDTNSRGQGLGKKLMTEIITHTTGDIALHVDATNPAKKLYESLGFTNPYLEMRLKK